MKTETGNAFQRHFENRLKELVQFHQQNGRWPGVNSKVDKERSLGVWYHKARNLFANGKLTIERQRQYERANCPLRLRDDNWNQRFASLKSFLKKHKRLPISGEELYTVSTWQFSRFNKLPEERKQQLKAIGFIDLWIEFKHKRENHWEIQFERLKAFFKKHKKTPTHRTNPSLEGWLSKQRQNLKKGILPKDNLSKLESIGVDPIGEKFFERNVHQNPKRYWSNLVWIISRNSWNRLPPEIEIDKIRFH